MSPLQFYIFTILSFAVVMFYFGYKLYHHSELVRQDKWCRCLGHNSFERIYIKYYLLGLSALVLLYLLSFMLPIPLPPIMKNHIFTALTLIFGIVCILFSKRVRHCSCATAGDGRAYGGHIFALYTGIMAIILVGLSYIKVIYSLVNFKLLE